MEVAGRCFSFSIGHPLIFQGCNGKLVVWSWGPGVLGYEPGSSEVV